MSGFQACFILLNLCLDKTLQYLLGTNFLRRLLHVGVAAIRRVEPQPRMVAVSIEETARKYVYLLLFVKVTIFKNN